MPYQLKNRLRAFFLLMVFSLNTIAGFACSVGVDMGYNKHHHQHKAVSSKKQCKEHQQHLKLGNAVLNQTKTNGDCCSNDVAKFTLLDKSVANNNLRLQTPVILLAFATTFLSQALQEAGLAVNSTFQFVRRSCFLNDTNIQTAIRRFQI